MSKRYVLLEKRFEHESGTIVHEYGGPDYGLCSDDKHYSGEEHMAVSLDGKVPFFTAPIRILGDAPPTPEDE